MPFDSISSLTAQDRMDQHHMHLKPWDPLYRAVILFGLVTIIYV